MKTFQTWKGHHVCSSSILDGRDTDAELLDIQTAQPDDIWALRAQLLGDSPHLSMEVLMETSDRTDVFPDYVLFEILSANPDELKKDTLIRYLENKEDPLPAYMIAILQQVAGGITYKTVLQEQMAKYNRLKTIAAYDIIRSNLNDSVVNMTELRNWLDNIGNIRADKQIIASYLQETNYTNALALANMLPDLYELKGNDSIEHNYFMDLVNLQITMKQQGRNIFQLDSTELVQLVNIADSSTGTAGTQARNILEYAYGYNYCNCPDISDTAGYKNYRVDFGDFNKLCDMEITVEPNPAITWTAFNYELPSKDSEGIIKIMNVSGKLIETITVSGKQGQKVWDTQKVPSGLYFYTLMVNGSSKTGKIIISK